LIGSDDLNGSIKQSCMHASAIDDSGVSGSQGRFPDDVFPALHHRSPTHLEGTFERMVEAIEDFTVGCIQRRHAENIEGCDDPHLKVLFIPDCTTELDEEPALVVL
jgi:hypothetical protein